MIQKLERPDKIITNAKPEESILIDDTQNDNDDKERTALKLVSQMLKIFKMDRLSTMMLVFVWLVMTCT